MGSLFGGKKQKAIVPPAPPPIPASVSTVPLANSTASASVDAQAAAEAEAKAMQRNMGRAKMVTNSVGALGLADQFAATKKKKLGA